MKIKKSSRKHEYQNEALRHIKGSIRLVEIEEVMRQFPTVGTVKDIVRSYAPSAIDARIWQAISKQDEKIADLHNAINKANIVISEIAALLLAVERSLKTKKQ